jgi:hypothetical protein
LKFYHLYFLRILLSLLLGSSRSAILHNEDVFELELARSPLAIRVYLIIEVLSVFVAVPQVVRLLMGCQVRGLRESFVAVLKAAHVRFFACVGTQVSSQIEIQAEAFAAYFTLVGLLTSVHQLMSF